MRVCCGHEVSKAVLELCRSAVRMNPILEQNKLFVQWMTLVLLLAIDTQACNLCVVCNEWYSVDVWTLEIYLIEYFMTYLLHRHSQDPVCTQCWARRGHVLQTLPCRGGGHTVNMMCIQTLHTEQCEYRVWGDASDPVCRCWWGGRWGTGWGSPSATGTPSVELVL